MREHLVFRLTGPLAAWGDVTVGEIRSSWTEPSKSAVLGLVAGALGVVRKDEARHAQLHADLGFAVRVDGKKRLPLRDFHTAQSPTSRKNTRWPTRADELKTRHVLKGAKTWVREKEDPNTILSERWHFQNVSAVVALWTRGRERENLADLAEALKRPVFSPYLGRKACPLSLPMRPVVIAAPDAAAALSAHPRQEWALLRDVLRGLRKNKVSRYGLERRMLRKMCAAPGSEIWAEDHPGAQTRTRRDAFRTRDGWSFSDRTETRLDAEPTPGGT